MLGPLFDLEWSLAAQRGRLDLFRRAYALILILQLVMLGRGEDDTIYQFAQHWTVWFLVQQCIVIVLVTPIAVAGAIGDEKARGSLQFLLLTDLNAWEIVAGKCLGRVAQVGILLLAGLPLLGFLSALGGFPFTTMLMVAAFSTAFLFALGGISALAAVWTRQTRQAVMAVYLVAAVYALAAWSAHRFALPVPSLVQPFHPMHLLAPVLRPPDPPTLAWRLLGATFAWTAVGVLSLLLAVWRLRPAYCKELQGRPRQGRWLQRGAPTEEPVRWKESQVERPILIPLIGAMPAWLGALLFFAAMLAWSGFSLLRRRDPRLLLLEQSLAVVLFASLLVGIRASGAVSGEREHNTWELLLATPLETEELLRGKLQGILDAMTPFLIAYAVFAMIPSVTTFDLFAAVLTLVALAATWLAMYVLGTAGILCSTRAASSGQSLINTMVTGYGFSNLRCCLLGTRASFLAAACFFGATISYSFSNGHTGNSPMVLISVLGLAVCLALGPGFALWYRAQEFIDSAIAYVDKRERAYRRPRELD